MTHRLAHTIPGMVRTTMNACAEMFGTTVRDIVGPSRVANIVSARHSCAWLLYKHLSMSNAAIGAVLGGRDHATVINARKQVNRLIDTGDYAGMAALELEAALFPPTEWGAK